MVLYIDDIANVMTKIASRLEAKGLKLKRYSTAFTPDGDTIVARFSDEALLDKVWHLDILTDEEKTNIANSTIFTANIPTNWFTQQVCDIDDSYDLTKIPGWEELNIETKGALRACYLIYNAHPIWRYSVYKKYPSLR